LPEATRLAIHVLAAVAEHEREMIAKRTRDGLAAARARARKLAAMSGTAGNFRMGAAGTMAPGARPSMSQQTKSTLPSIKFAMNATLRASRSSLPTRSVARGQLGELRPVIALAALHLDELAEQLPAAAVEIVGGARWFWRARGSGHGVIAG